MIIKSLIKNIILMNKYYKIMFNNENNIKKSKFVPRAPG